MTSGQHILQFYSHYTSPLYRWHMSQLCVVFPDRAVEILRSASLSNHMCLLIARDEESRWTNPSFPLHRVCETVFVRFNSDEHFYSIFACASSSWCVFLGVSVVQLRSPEDIQCCVVITTCSLQNSWCDLILIQLKLVPSQWDLVPVTLRW